MGIVCAYDAPYKAKMRKRKRRDTEQKIVIFSFLTPFKSKFGSQEVTVGIDPKRN